MSAAKPVPPGTVIGTMTCDTGAPLRTTRVWWRCTGCGKRTQRKASYFQLTVLVQNGSASGCVRCHKKTWKLSDEERERRLRECARRSSTKRRLQITGLFTGHNFHGRHCDHPKVVVCVDPARGPNGSVVEILRCPKCDAPPDGRVPWSLPDFSLRATFPGRDDHPDDGNPSFENAVRTTEEVGNHDYEKIL